MEFFHGAAAGAVHSPGRNAPSALDRSAYPLRLPRPFLSWGGVYWPPREPGVFYLTIDDGPEPEALFRLLEVLARHEARATFFWLAQKVDTYHQNLPIAHIYAQGHRVELHGYVHVSPWRLSRRSWLADVERGLRILSERLPERPRYYRPPYGRYRSLPRAWGMETVLWDLMPPDYRMRKGWAYPAARYLKAGDVIVLHERLDADWDEWETFLTLTAQKGLRAVPLPCGVFPSPGWGA